MLHRRREKQELRLEMLDVLGKKDHEEFRAVSLEIVANIGHRLVRDVL